jgi:hypothetical protein
MLSLSTPDSLIHGFILLVLLPAWLVVGLVDWNCHRKARVELTAGPKESALHLVLSGEAAIAVLSGVLLEINALVLTVIVVAFVAHEITTNIDVHIAFPARAFTTTEQRAHDFLTAIPFAAVCLVLSTHTGQLLAIFGQGDGAADWTLRWKTPPLPLAYIVAWNSAALLLNVLPYTEELMRSLKAARAGRAAAPPIAADRRPPSTGSRVPR